MVYAKIWTIYLFVIYTNKYIDNIQQNDAPLLLCQLNLLNTCHHLEVREFIILKLLFLMLYLPNEVFNNWKGLQLQIFDMPHFWVYYFFTLTFYIVSKVTPLTFKDKIFPALVVFTSCPYIQVCLPVL